MTTAEIITIGTELLLGETADTNTRFIARALRGLGVDLFRAQTVGVLPGRTSYNGGMFIDEAEIEVKSGQGGE